MSHPIRLALRGGANLYAFVGNSPLDFWDPFGLDGVPYNLSAEERFRKGVRDRRFNDAIIQQAYEDANRNNPLEGLIPRVAPDAQASDPFAGKDQRAAAKMLELWLNPVPTDADELAGYNLQAKLATKQIAIIVPPGLLGARSVVGGAASHGFRSFSAFKRAFGSAGSGKAWHHIVEQTPANVARFGSGAINNTANLARIPHGAGSVHAKLSGLYSSIRPDITGSATLRVRDWLSGQSFQVQYSFGQRALQNVAKGVWP